MNPGRPVTEEDLHSYVDAVLDPARRAVIDEYLRHHPDVAQRLRVYAQQREALRAAFAPIAEEPIPPELSLARLVEAHRHPSRTAPWRAAAAVLLFGLGGVGGWTLHGGMSYTHPSGITALAQEAAFNYSVYSPDRVHPVELTAANRDELVDWISKRLNTSIMVPDLSPSGYRFMGGRLVATPHGPAGLLMYDNDHGIRLVMFIKPMKIDKNTTSMLQSADGSITGFSWANNGLGYSVVGTASSEILHPLANEIRRQVNTSI
jgi:anti-sigma factor RsiW